MALEEKTDIQMNKRNENPESYMPCMLLVKSPPNPHQKKKKNKQALRERETVLPGSKIFIDLGEVTWKEVQRKKDESMALCF